MCVCAVCYANSLQLVIAALCTFSQSASCKPQSLASHLASEGYDSHSQQWQGQQAVKANDAVPQQQHLSYCQVAGKSCHDPGQGQLQRRAPHCFQMLSHLSLTFLDAPALCLGMSLLAVPLIVYTVMAFYIFTAAHVKQIQQNRQAVLRLLASNTLATCAPSKAFRTF